MDLLAGQISRHQLWQAGDRWLLAVSGGPDSMALLVGICQLRRQTDWPGPESLLVAHLNHRLRGAESDEDAEFVRRQAGQWGLEVAVGSADVGQIARRSRESIETAARAERYHFLEQTARRRGCNKIVLGHNADDQAETILHRICRGTGVEGLAGMPVSRRLDRADGSAGPLCLIRPLLSLRREQILAFLADQKIPFRQDSSNLSLATTRNRLRHDLLARLARQFNPRIVESLLRLGRTAERWGAWVGRYLEAALERVVVQQRPDGMVLDARRLADCPAAEQTELFREILRRLEVPLRPIGFDHIDGLLELLDGPGESVVVRQLPGGVRVRRQGDRLYIEKIERGEKLPGRANGQSTVRPPDIVLPPTGYKRIEESIFGYPNGMISRLGALRLQCLDRREEDAGNLPADHPPGSETIDADAVVGDLHLRCRRAGDRFWPLGAPGAKTIGDFFTDAGLPVACRDRIGLLCDERGIVLVLGMRIAERVKMTPSSRRLLRIEPEFLPGRQD